MFGFGSWQGTAASQRLELMVPSLKNYMLPTWEPQVTIARNCRFPEVGTPGSQPGNQRLPLQATAGYQRLKLMFPNQYVTIAKNFQILKVGTDGSQRGNQRQPWQGTARSQTLKLTVLNLGTRGYYCKELPVPKS